MPGTVRHGNPTEVPSPTAGTHATPRDWVLARSVPAGGVAGQALYKQSSTDYDEAWSLVPPVATGSVASALAPDASVGGNLRDVTVTGSSITVAVPTNGINRQTIEYAFYAASAATVTFNSSYRLGTGIPSRAISIPAGGILYAAIKYSTLNNTWSLVAATVPAA